MSCKKTKAQDMHNENSGHKGRDRVEKEYVSGDGDEFQQEEESQLEFSCMAAGERVESERSGRNNKRRQFDWQGGLGPYYD